VPDPGLPSREDLAAQNAELAARNGELAARNVELGARVGELMAVVAGQAALIESLRAEVAVLRRQAGRDSSNSSQPPGQDGPAAKAKKKASQRRAQPGRAQGGQKGHPGASLAWSPRADETVVVGPGACGGCGADLAGAPGRVASAVQVHDVPPAALTVTEYQMMSRACKCGQVTAAPAPAGVTGGPVCYGPNVIAAATLLASTDVIGIERAADLMGALFKAPVSTGFVSRCLVRLDAALTAAGFEDALKEALRAAEVLGTDETPAPLTTAATGTEGRANPHVYTVRTLRGWAGGGPDLIWYGAAGNRTKAAITGFAILDGYAGILVRDDYGGYLSYDAHLAGVQQCLAHLYRYLDDAYAIDPVSQVWTRQAGDALRDASAAVRAARAGGHASLDPGLLGRAAAQLRPGRHLRYLRQPVPALAQGKPPRPGPGPAAQAKGRPGLAIHDPVRRPRHEQRIRKRRPRLQARRENQRLLAHPGHPATPLPNPLVPDHRPQPRLPPPRRHPSRPHRQPLDAAHPSMIN
jgi:transposase